MPSPTTGTNSALGAVAPVAVREGLVQRPNEKEAKDGLRRWPGMDAWKICGTDET